MGLQADKNAWNISNHDEVQEMTDRVVNSIHWSGRAGASVDILKGEMLKLIDMLPGTGSDQMQRKVLMSLSVNEAIIPFAWDFNQSFLHRRLFIYSVRCLLSWFPFCCVDSDLKLWGRKL